nr:dehalogenase [Schizophyllum commune]
MPPVELKEFVTSRGFKYSYRFIPAAQGKPTLLLLHGFPSTSYGWRHQIEYFSDKGYGVISPNMLGYHPTDQPTDPRVYAGSRQAQDLLDIIEAENIEGVIAVGHDRGAMPVSYLAVLHEQRFLGFAFLAGGLSLGRGFDLNAVLPMLKEEYGTEIIGYWKFLNKDGSETLIENNVDSFMELLFPEDPALWKTDLNDVGAINAWLAQGKRAPRAHYLIDEDYDYMRGTFLEKGMAGPLNWYKVVSRGLQDSDGLDLPADKVKITKPTLYLGGEKDYVCIPEWTLKLENMEQACHSLRVRTFDCGHWMQHEIPGQINDALEEWMVSNGIATLTGK